METLLERCQFKSVRVPSPTRTCNYKQSAPPGLEPAFAELSLGSLSGALDHFPIRIYGSLARGLPQFTAVTVVSGRFTVRKRARENCAERRGWPSAKTLLQNVRESSPQATDVERAQSRW